jgi:hypothetical protein
MLILTPIRLLRLHTKLQMVNSLLLMANWHRSKQKWQQKRKSTNKSNNLK